MTSTVLAENGSGPEPSSWFLAWSETWSCSNSAETMNRMSESSSQPATAIASHRSTRFQVILRRVARSRLGPRRLLGPENSGSSRRNKRGRER